MILKRRNVQVKLKLAIETEWFLLNSSVIESTLKFSPNFDSRDFTVVEFKMTIRRRFTYYIFKIIFPFTIISFITIFTFLLQPDSGEKLQLDVTILLSLVFYLNMMSEYIPRGYSKTPILTLYALSNFILVFLSSSFTVFILRLYYRPPYRICGKPAELPILIKIFLFKYIAPLIHIKVKQQTTKNKSLTINEELLLKKEEIKLNIYEKEAKQVLRNLIDLNKKLTGQNKHEYQVEERNLIFEDWKIAALILDRLLFFIFLFSTPCTILFFTRSNILTSIFSKEPINISPPANNPFCQ